MMADDKSKNKSAKKSVCCSVLDENGFVLRVLPNMPAVHNWASKHFPGKKMMKKLYRSKYAVLREFDRQMQLGLTDTNVIDDLLYYGGVSTAWRPQPNETEKCRRA